MVHVGSPPLARRGRRPWPARARSWRLTSARAERTCRSPGHHRRTSAHLRSRGEDGYVQIGRHVSGGSPPLARRGRPAADAAGLQVRLTSARAERTHDGLLRHLRLPAHLRSRGEDPVFGWTRSPSSGSPPLARRGQPLVGGAGRRLRLTSARAERTQTRPVGVTSWDGSPPLARRGPRQHERYCLDVRLTSARAERTLTDRLALAVPAAHLRSRGEDSSRPGWAVSPGGSPPLARRGPIKERDSAQQQRLTSARAERTCWSLSRGTSRAAHLRSRGEDSRDMNQRRSMIGSPPLARRGPPRPPGRRHRQRLTSARAERTSASSSSSTSSAAHLRSRGEDAFSWASSAACCGSPPLARRGPRVTMFEPIRYGLTSARAERTW